MSRFIAIDFETANHQRSSACQLGVSVFEDNKIVAEYQSLLRPYPYYFLSTHVRVHGIEAADVIDAPSFEEYWQEISHLFTSDALVVAHNASFDMSVLRACFDTYGIAYPSLKYGCSYLTAKNLVRGLPSYSLSKICARYGITFQHHDALEDARACGLLSVELLKFKNVSSWDELIENEGYEVGKLFPEGYTPFRSYKKGRSNWSSIERIDTKSITSRKRIFDPNHPFFQKRVVFTGSLKSMNRHAAMQAVVDAGGIVHPQNLSMATSFLVMNQKYYRNFSLVSGHKTSKMKKVRAYIEKGVGIEVIGEEQFKELLEF